MSGTTASAIDSAISAAKAKGSGTTVVFPAGSYAHGNLTWPDGINLQGAGIGQTQINCGVRFGSNATITGATFGSTSASTLFHFTNGGHDTTISDCRFRGRSTDLWEMVDFADWGGPIYCSDANFHDMTFTRCEFESTGVSNGRTFNMFWDARAGGGSIYDVTWQDCAFGVKNSSGKYGAGNCALLLQPSPAEHDAGGPRPNGIDNPIYDFDWSSITHGAGQAANGGSTGYGFRVTGSDFVGAASLASLDLCDFIRAWAMTTYHLSSPNGVTAAMEKAAPDRLTSKGWYVANNRFSGNFIDEIGRNVTDTGNTEYAGTTTYSVSDTVKQHDTQLYGF